MGQCCTTTNNKEEDESTRKQYLDLLASHAKMKNEMSQMGNYCNTIYSELLTAQANVRRTQPAMELLEKKVLQAQQSLELAKQLNMKLKQQTVIVMRDYMTLRGRYLNKSASHHREEDEEEDKCNSPIFIIHDYEQEIKAYEEITASSLLSHTAAKEIEGKEVKNETYHHTIFYDLDGTSRIRVRLTPKVIDDKTAISSQTTPVHWFWQESRNPDRWQPYPDYVSVQIEALYLDHRGVLNLTDTESQIKYSVDTDKMVQLNIETRSRRKIARNINSETEMKCCHSVLSCDGPPPLFVVNSSASAHPLSSLSPMEKPVPFTLNQIATNTVQPLFRIFISKAMEEADKKQMIAFFKSRWQDKSTAQRVVVTRVERFVNTTALQMYRARAATCGAPHEQLLFHCTGKTDYMTVARNGLDIRRADTSGKLWYGQASYLSDSSGLSHKYAHRETTGDYVTLIVRCLVGNICDYGKTRKPHLKLPESGYDSVRGTSKKGCQVHAIYDNSQSLVEAAIHYHLK